MRVAKLGYSGLKQMTNPARKLRVLFVCIGNSCRSPMAESIAWRDAADLVESASAGLSPLGGVHKLALATLEANGYRTDGLYSKPILNDAWTKADLVINMSGYPREGAFRQSDWHKVEDWSVDDPYGSDLAAYQRTFEDIRAKIESLLVRLRDRRPRKS